MSDIPLRSIAELQRRRQQQLTVAENTDHQLTEVEARSVAKGYATSIDILNAMRSDDGGERPPKPDGYDMMGNSDD